MKKNILDNKWFTFFVFAIAVFTVFAPAYNSLFLPWDDSAYITENADIKSFTSGHLKNIFTNSYLGNYQPVSLLTYMIDYKLGGEQPFWYHFNNLLFHFLNGILVFFLVKKISNKKAIAAVVALIFLVHPVQAESVMWVAERKNLVYVFFFLAASLAYFNFKEKGNRKYYLYTFVLFMLSLLSKGTAVAFPLCLVAYDVMRGEKISKKNILEKIPFFAASVLIGVITIMFQERDGFINEAHDFGVLTKLLNAGYAFCIYLYKLLVPVSLSSYYPFPQQTGALQVICFLLMLTVFAGVFFMLKKKLKTEGGAVLFFIFNIVFVLQFIPFGEVLVAERYNYLGSLGIILCLVLLVERFLQSEEPANKKTLRKRQNPVSIKGIFALLVIGLFSFLCFKRNQVWKDSFTFYGDILKKFPDSYIILSSLGAEYTRVNNFEEAHDYFRRAIQKNPQYYTAHYHEGVSYLKQGKIELAYNSLSNCIEITPYYKALHARASLLKDTKQFVKAINDEDEVIRQKPDWADAYYLRAFCKDQMGRTEESLADYNTAIQLNPNAAIYFLNRAVAFRNLKRDSESVADLNKAIELKDDYAQAYFLRGLAKYHLKQNPCSDLLKAEQLGYPDAGNAARKICR